MLLTLHLQFTNSAVTISLTLQLQFHLLCSYKFISFAVTVWLTPGFLCDHLLRYGRRPMFFVGVIMLLVSGVIASFAPSIYVFLPVYFMQGAAKTGAYLVAFILCEY